MRVVIRMNKFFAAGALAVSLCAVAAAHSRGDHDDGFDGGSHHEWHHMHTVAAPEIGAGSAVAALALLAGGLAVLRGRKPGR